MTVTAKTSGFHLTPAFLSKPNKGNVRQRPLTLLPFTERLRRQGFGPAYRLSLLLESKNDAHQISVGFEGIGTGVFSFTS